MQTGFKAACQQIDKYVNEVSTELEIFHEAQNKTLEQIVAKIKSENQKMKQKKTQKIKDMYGKLMAEFEQRKKVKLGELGA